MKMWPQLLLSMILVMSSLTGSSTGADWMFRRSNYSYSKGLHGANRYSRAPNTSGVLMRRGYRYQDGITETWVQWVRF